MTSIDNFAAQLPGVERHDIERWILLDWIRPDREGNGYVFQAVDIARARLIREMRDEMKLNEDAMPVVLVLLDQLYETRRRMREVGTAITKLVPEELLFRLRALLSQLET